MAGDWPGSGNACRAVTAATAVALRLVFLPSATRLTPDALAHASAVVFLLTTATPSTQRVVVVDRSTPATRSLPRVFSIHEEFYVFSHDPLSRLHVLARLDGLVHHPLVWCRRAERGRVFYDRSGTSRRRGATRGRSR